MKETEPDGVISVASGWVLHPEKDDQLAKASRTSLNEFGETGQTAFNNKIAIWSGGYVNFGDFNADETAISSTTVGASGGIDYRFS